MGPVFSTPKTLLEPSPLEHRHHHAVGRADREQVHDHRFERHEQAAEHGHQEQEAQHEHRADEDRQPRGQPLRHVDARRGEPADVHRARRCRATPSGITSSRSVSTRSVGASATAASSAGSTRITAASPDGLGDRRRHRGDVGRLAQARRPAVSSEVVSAPFGNSAASTSGPLNPAPKPVGHEVVGAPRRVGRRVAAGVGEREAHREQRDREHDQDREATGERGPRAALDRPGSTGTTCACSRGLGAPAAPDREAVDGAHRRSPAMRAAA